MTINHIINGPHIFIAGPGSHVSFIIPESGGDQDVGMVDDPVKIYLVKYGDILVNHICDSL
jgi:hypothetical protein